MKWFQISVFVVFASSACVADTEGNKQADQLFSAATSAAPKAPNKAIHLFEKAATFAHSSHLHANLGLLYHQTGRFDKAILHFRKALLLDPGNEEIKASLHEVRKDAQLNAAEQESFFAPEKASFWAWTTIILFWSGSFGALFLFRGTLPFYLKATAFTFWIGLVGTGGYASYQSHKSLRLLEREAVVIMSAENHEEAKGVQLRDLTGKVLSHLKPGSIVRIELAKNGSIKKRFLAEMKATQNRQAVTDECYFIRSATDNKKGWIRKKDLELICCSPSREEQ